LPFLSKTGLNDPPIIVGAVVIDPLRIDPLLKFIRSLTKL